MCSLQRILVREKKLRKSSKVPNSMYNMIPFVGGNVGMRAYAEENYRGFWNTQVIPFGMWENCQETDLLHYKLRKYLKL